MRIVVALFVSCLFALPSQALTLYIAPNGNDAWTGRLRAPAEGGQDGPLATLEGARDAVRKARSNGRRLVSEVEVVLLAGDYRRDHTFALSEEDGGSDEVHVVYRAEEGETPRLLGGTLLQGLAPVEDAAVLARLPEAARGKVLQADLKALGITDYGTLKARGFGRGGEVMAMELFFDGQPMTLARWPNEDWLKIAGVPEGPQGGKFNYAEDRPNGWAASNDIWVHGYWTWDWADSAAKVAQLDKEKKEITTAEPHGVYGYKEGGRYYFFNVLEELDSPGEYYIDRGNGKLYFWPPTAIEGKEIAVSQLESPLVKVENANNVRIEGLHFAYTRGPGLQMEGGRA